MSYCHPEIVLWLKMYNNSFMVVIDSLTIYKITVNIAAKQALSRLTPEYTHHLPMFDSCCGDTFSVFVFEIYNAIFINGVDRIHTAIGVCIFYGTFFSNIICKGLNECSSNVANYISRMCSILECNTRMLILDWMS